MRTFGESNKPGQIINHDKLILPTYRLLLGHNRFIMRQVHNIRILKNSKTYTDITIKSCKQGDEKL